MSVIVRIMARNNWTEEGTLMAFALYFILPSGSWDKKDVDVIALANHINRTHW